ncbi:hypothetical protein [Ruminococcus sp. FC2018]|uniref:hypothetical protein n=1 Tax=Ruminococcus sp. FC2018 TaxID=1410617 RepID=UPI0006876569|nr:hypothetical protein [Ruminococcus sp. FC2018]
MKEKNSRKGAYIAIAVLSVISILVACTSNNESAESSKTERSSVVTKVSENSQQSVQISSESDSDSSVESVSTYTSGNAVAGVSDINIVQASSSNTSLSSKSVLVTIGNKKVDLSGAYVVDGITAEIIGGTYRSDTADQNVFLVINGGKLKLSNAEIIKTGNASQNDSKRSSDVSDDYNFYGINSIILVVGEESSAEISNCKLTSDCSGANAVFSTSGAKVNVNNVLVSTTGNSSRGVYATYNGTINADHVDITTTGAHCAPIATDRGGGNVNVTNSVVKCSGDGSPCIYSTGNIKVDNLIGTSTGSQAAVIEGKNSITMLNSKLTASGGNNGVMLYQSMSGDASDKDAKASVSTLEMTNSTITNNSKGPMFYITNTTSVINLNGGNTLTSENGELVNAATGRWGKDGSNGGKLTINIAKDTLSDSISADDISSVTVQTSDNGRFNGKTSGNVTT